MLLHRYLEEVLGNKVSISLFRTMIRYKGMVFTARRLAQEANVSAAMVALLTHKLEKLGIIRIQPIGRAHHLQLNEKSYILNKIIKPIIDAEKNTVSELVKFLKKHLDTEKIISAVIYGSVATGEEKIDSDIDLFIVSDDFDSAITAVSESRDVYEIFSGSTSPLVFTKKEFVSKKNTPLVRSIIANHIKVCGKDLDSIK